MEQKEGKNEEDITQLEQAKMQIKELQEKIASMTKRNSIIDAEMDEIKV